MKFVAPSESDIAFRRPFRMLHIVYVFVCVNTLLKAFYETLRGFFCPFSRTDVKVGSICIRVTSFKRRGKQAPTQKNKGRKW